jgi:hypothetical protein
MSKRNHKAWRTRDLYLASFLFARGIPIIGVYFSHGEIVFAFVDSAERENWCDQFSSGTPSVDARIYAVAVSALQQRATDALMNIHA